MPERRFQSTAKSDELVERILAETAKQARTAEVIKKLSPQSDIPPQKREAENDSPTP